MRKLFEDLGRTPARSWNSKLYHISASEKTIFQKKVHLFLPPFLAGEPVLRSSFR